MIFCPTSSFLTGERFGATIPNLFPHGQGLVDVIYQNTEVREELQKKVDFGPFKVMVDDGLPLRKSAYSCLSQMLDNAQDLLGSISGQLIPCVSHRSYSCGCSSSLS